MELKIKDKILLLDKEDFKKYKSYRFYLKKDGYCLIYKKGIGTLNFHRTVTNCPKGLTVDHINRNPFDNRKTNLRICTLKQNGANQSISTRNKSGFKGVHWCKHKNRWRSIIITGGKRYHVGYFSDKIEAAKRYNEKAKELFGEFAYINKI